MIRFTRTCADTIGTAVTLAGLLCMLAGCGDGARGKVGYEDLRGRWTHTKQSGVVVELEISELGHYSYAKSGIMQSFPGEMTLSEGQVVFVDRYCGTSLPGVYRIEFGGFKGGKPTTFELTKIDDEICTRKTDFPGEWARVGDARLSSR